MLALFLTVTFSVPYLQHEEKSFVSWMRRTNQFYTGDEYHFRLGIWMSKLRFVQEHNAKGSSYKVSMNHLSAMTHSEYRSLLGLRFSDVTPKMITHAQKSTAESLDWREKGAVNPVLDQGNCGSCWAFSVLHCCEGIEFLNYNKLYKFSEQSLVDCVQLSHGCNGGLPAFAYNYIIDECEGKIMEDKDYPYEAVDGECRFVQSKAIGHFSKWLQIVKGDEDDLAAKCEKYGPVSVGMDADHFTFEIYSGGIYEEKICSKEFLDHAVGLVGFGKEGETPYWILRNSWGTEWGENGYFRLIRGQNMCGVATSATVIITK
ncbi:Cathepsin L1 [Tritrichomonas foetus]|uniref:Cathepsin L1 n=1 Tax=Tritrichomonas foetus TaxID=1144522 RepID=A0A1J4JX13_9EUKA|nr:Cathepsin L1 [Tritrichomonas foetus]|eukprot:OHT03689.1 Cathepsin L1 [Tritrichomonas foetus]